MSQDEHHQEALIETARLELDRAHRGVISMEAGEVRRGLQLALAALRGLAGEPYGVLAGRVESALADLDAGSLADMDNLIEAVRKDIAS